MFFFICRDPKFDEAISSLRQSGGKALFAAKKADEIISKLTSGENRWLHQAGKFTKKGENRIRYCRKHDLGNGYRLITIQRGTALILSYIGNHDDCDRWLERNKGLSYEIVEKQSELSEKFGNNGNPSADDQLPEDVLEEKRIVEEYEQTLMEKLNDSSVQKIISTWFMR